MVVGALSVLTLFRVFGRPDLAFPALLCIAMISFAVYSNWKLKSFWWFWASIALIAAIHIYFVPRLPWGTEHLSSIVAIPIGLLDFGLVVGFIKLVEMICRDREDSNESQENRSR